MKRFFFNLTSITAVLLAFVLVQMIGFISLQNPLRANWSEGTYYDLSEKTRSLLNELEHTITVIVFFQEEHRLYYDIKNLLEEYQYYSRNIQVEWVDPARDLARTEKLAGQYGLTEAQIVVFDIGGRSKVVKQADLAEFQITAGQQRERITAFKGEQVFSSVIHGLIQGDIPTVYFLGGHGERQISNFDPISGFSKIGTVIRQDNLQVKELTIGSAEQIPNDAAALILAGPSTKRSPVEIEMIEEYLNRGGRVLLLLDALKQSGLELLLRRWGIELRNDFVVDPENTLRGNDVHIRRYNTDHPISIDMDSIVQFLLPRSIEPLHRADAATASAEDRSLVTPLLYTSDKSWSETQVEEATAKYDEDTGDKRGPFSLGVAVERGAAKETLDVHIRTSRMVVFGDSDFVANGSMVGGNEWLFMGALNWLLERDELLAIAPKLVEEVKLILSRCQIRRLFWINVAGIPAVAMMLGLGVWLRRRK